MGVLLRARTGDSFRIRVSARAIGSEGEEEGLASSLLLMLLLLSFPSVIVEVARVGRSWGGASIAFFA